MLNVTIAGIISVQKLAKRAVGAGAAQLNMFSS
jgi:hypothetical protein